MFRGVSMPVPSRRPVLLPLLLLTSLLLPLLFAHADEERRYALLVGVTKYGSDHFPPLKYTENDAEEMAKLLTKAGFEVRVLTTSRGEKDAKDAPTAANVRAALDELVQGKKRR